MGVAAAADVCNLGDSFGFEYNIDCHTKSFSVGACKQECWLDNEVRKTDGSSKSKGDDDSRVHIQGDAIHCGMLASENELQICESDDDIIEQSVDDQTISEALQQLVDDYLEVHYEGRGGWINLLAQKFIDSESDCDTSEAESKPFAKSSVEENDATDQGYNDSSDMSLVESSDDVGYTCRADLLTRNNNKSGLLPLQQDPETIFPFCNMDPVLNTEMEPSSLLDGDECLQTLSRKSFGFAQDSDSLEPAQTVEASAAEDDEIMGIGLEKSASTHTPSNQDEAQDLYKELDQGSCIFQGDDTLQVEDESMPALENAETPSPKIASRILMGYIPKAARARRKSETIFPFCNMDPVLNTNATQMELDRKKKQEADVAARKKQDAYQEKENERNRKKEEYKIELAKSKRGMEPNRKKKQEKKQREEDESKKRKEKHQSIVIPWKF